MRTKKSQAIDDIGIRSTKFNSNCSFFCAHLKRNLCSWFIWQAETRDFVLTIIAITPNCLFRYQERLFFVSFNFDLRLCTNCLLNVCHFIWIEIFISGFSAITMATIYLSDAQQEITNGCNTNCSSEWNSQICATNDEGKTKLFPSECVMKSENCLNKSSKLTAISIFFKLPFLWI